MLDASRMSVCMSVHGVLSGRHKRIPFHAKNERILNNPHSKITEL